MTGALPAAPPGAAAQLPANRNRPDLKLGQKHDPKHTAGLEVLGCASSSDPWLLGPVCASSARNLVLKM